MFCWTPPREGVIPPPSRLIIACLNLREAGSQADVCTIPPPGFKSKDSLFKIIQLYHLFLSAGKEASNPIWKRVIFKRMCFISIYLKVTKSSKIQALFVGLSIWIQSCPSPFSNLQPGSVQWIQTHRRVKMDFWQKKGHSWAVHESIQKNSKSNRVKQIVIKHQFSPNFENIWMWVFPILLCDNLTSECWGLCKHTLAALMHQRTANQRTDMLQLDCVNVLWMHTT